MSNPSINNEDENVYPMLFRLYRYEINTTTGDPLAYTQVLQQNNHLSFYGGPSPANRGHEAIAPSFDVFRVLDVKLTWDYDDLKTALEAAILPSSDIEEREVEIEIEVETIIIAWDNGGNAWQGRTVMDDRDPGEVNRLLRMMFARGLRDYFCVYYTENQRERYGNRIANGVENGMANRMVNGMDEDDEREESDESGGDEGDEKRDTVSGRGSEGDLNF